MVPLRVGLSPEDQREPATVATFEQVNLCYAPGQTESGQPAIGVGLRLEDGTLLEGLTTWRLFRLAYRALESRIDGMRQRGELPPRSEDDLNLDLRWDMGRGVAGAWNLDHLDKHALEALRQQATDKLRGDVREGGPACACVAIQDADRSRHFDDCPRSREPS